MHVILENEAVEIPDTLADPRLCDNPLCLNAGAEVSITKAVSAREGLGLKIIAATVRQLSGTTVTEQGGAGYRTTIEVGPQVA